jgi:rubrerythrin
MVMALTTFGAIMGFAAEMAGKDEEVYKVLAQKAKDLSLRDALQALSEEEGKTHNLMIKARRENVTEMILEPVADLQQEDYEIDPKISGSVDNVSLLKVALMLEERGKRFFRDASSKVPLPEVARIFRKAAQKKEESLTRLQNLGLNRTVKKRT